MKKHIYTKTEVRELYALVKKFGYHEGATRFANKYNLDRNNVKRKIYSLKKEGVLSYRREGLCNDPKVIRIFKKEIEKSPNNLTMAFKRISEKTGLKETTVSNYWHIGRGQLGKDRMATCFALVSKDKVASNRKIFKTLKDNNKVGIIEFIKKIFKLS